MSFLSFLPLIGTAIDSIFGFGSQAATNASNKELAKYQNELNLQQWYRSNEYNLPSNQRKRIEDAGLNPYLMYGHGQVANTAAPSPNFTAPNLQAYTNSAVGSGFTQALQYSLQARKLRADVEKTETETAGLRTHNLQSEFEYSLRDLKRSQMELDNAYSRIRNAKSDIDRQIAYKELEFWKDKFDTEMENLRSNTANKKAQTDYITGPQTDIANSTIKKNAASVVESLSRASLNNAQIEAVSASIEKDLASAGLSKAQSVKVARECGLIIEQSANARTENEKRQAEVRLLNLEYLLKDQDYRSGVRGGGREANVMRIMLKNLDFIRSYGK